MATVGPISQYEILRKIARGGMGEVYLARQRGIAGFAKEVVIKRIHSDLAEDPAFVDMFLQEARIAALLDHPNIVLIYELGKQGEDYFIVMEYVRGLSLSRLMKAARDAIPIPFAIQIAAGVAAGLQFAHEQRDARGQLLNLVHRDISPPNVLVSTAGSVKITDFGIAKVRQSVTHTQAGVIKGKYSYIAPEQARGQPATPRSDIYSLGLVLYEMTTGQRAYPAGVDKEVLRAVANGQVAPPELYVTNYPEDLRAVLMRALEPDPGDRYQECQQLQEELLALLVNRQIVTSPAKLGQFVQQFVPEPSVPDRASRPLGDEATAPADLGDLADPADLGDLEDLEDEAAELESDPAGSETAELGSRRPDLPTDEVLDVAPILRPDEEDLPPPPGAASTEPRPLPDFDDDAETIMLDRKNQRPDMVQAPDAEEPTTPAEPPPPEAVVALQEPTEPPPPEAIDALLEPAAQPPPEAVGALPEPARQPPPESGEPAAQPPPACASSALADLILLEEMSGPGQEPAEQASAPSSWDQELAARGEPEAETEAAGSLTGAAGEVSVATRLPSPVLPWVLPISAMVVAGAVVTWLLLGRDAVEKPEPPTPAVAAPDVMAIAPDARPDVAPAPAVAAEPDASTPDLEPTIDQELAPDAAVRRPPRGRPARTAPRRGARTAIRRSVRRRPPPRVAPRPARPIGEALTVKVSVTTEPPTDVYLEGRHLGRAPLTANIPPTDSILAFKNRALGVLTTRPISPRGTQLSVRYVFRKGTLRFDIPAGRMVYLDGKYLGLSPIAPTPVYEGAHRVTVVDLKTKRKRRHRLMVGPKETVQVGD